MKTPFFCSIGNFSIFTFLYHKLAKLCRLTRASRNKYARTFKKGLGRSLIASTVSLDLRLNILYADRPCVEILFLHESNRSIGATFTCFILGVLPNYSLQRAANFHSMCIQSDRTISIPPLHKLSNRLFKVPMK